MSGGDKHLFGIVTRLFGRDHNGRWSPYLTRLRVGRLCLHVFHRGDAAPDPHDHPWSFWTLPLTSYVEEVPLRDGVERMIVRAGRIHYRPATYLHRVLGRYDRRGGHIAFRPGVDTYPVGDGSIKLGPAYKAGTIVTIVWRASGPTRKWGFMRRDAAGRRCWVPWKRYIEEVGESAACED